MPFDVQQFKFWSILIFPFFFFLLLVLFGVLSLRSIAKSEVVKIYLYVFIIRTGLLQEMMLVKKGMSRMGGPKMDISGSEQNIFEAMERERKPEGRNPSA